MSIREQIRSNNWRTVGILFLFTAVATLIVFVASLIMNAPPEQFPIISTVVFGAIFLWTIISYYYGDKIILSFVDAHPIERKDHFDLYNIVENLAITAGLPNPKVYLIKDDSLNAFATGRNPKNSVIGVTTGLLNKLNKNELEAVLAHEMGHIANYDIRLELILITVIGLISMAGEVMMRARGKNSGSIVFAGLFVYIIGSPILQLIRLAISRNREYQADVTGSVYTRDPMALADALEKISHDARIESADKLATASHLFIADPRHNGALDTKKKLADQSWISTIFSTHPPIGERIYRLKTSQ